MDIRDMKVDQVGVHMSHCNQDEYVGCCKYMEDDTCPALKNRRPQILDIRKTTHEELRRTVIDLVDGQSWWDIKNATGLPEDRCKEISELFTRLMNEKD